MTIRGQLISFFPILHFILILITLLNFIHHSTISNMFLCVFVIYFFPIICYHIHQYLCPLIEGTTNLASKSYSAWWGVHQIQGLYNAFPAIETLLKLIPGVYSAWLRLWGSKIGKNVYWTAQVEITDRNLLTVGNNIIFGHKTGCYAHVITNQNDVMLLYTKHIEIGNNVLIGAGTRMGPGAKIADGTMLPILSVVSVNQIVGDVAHANHKSRNNELDSKESLLS